MSEKFGTVKPGDPAFGKINSARVHLAIQIKNLREGRQVSSNSLEFALGQLDDAVNCKNPVTAR